MPSISVQIVRFVDGHQPGLVECELIDAEGRRHIIIDKVPVLTSENLDAQSKYPVPGSVPCEVLRRYRDESGRELVQRTIGTNVPIGTGAAAQRVDLKEDW
jgi:hypothetical protein